MKNVVLKEIRTLSDILRNLSIYFTESVYRSIYWGRTVVLTNHSVSIGPGHARNIPMLVLYV